MPLHCKITNYSKLTWNKIDVGGRGNITAGIPDEIKRMGSADISADSRSFLGTRGEYEKYSIWSAADSYVIALMMIMPTEVVGIGNGPTWLEIHGNKENDNIKKLLESETKTDHDLWGYEWKHADDVKWTDTVDGHNLTFSIHTAYCAGENLNIEFNIGE